MISSYRRILKIYTLLKKIKIYSLTLTTKRERRTNKKIRQNWMKKNKAKYKSKNRYTDRDGVRAEF